MYAVAAFRSPSAVMPVQCQHEPVLSAVHHTEEQVQKGMEN